MKTLSIICGILCLFDMSATAYEYSHNMIIEMNPIMDYFLGHSIVVFIIVKSCLTLLALRIFWIAYYRYNRKYVKLFVCVITVIYFITDVYHIIGLSI